MATSASTCAEGAALVVYCGALAVAGALSATRACGQGPRALARHRRLADVIRRGSLFGLLIAACYALRIAWYAIRVSGVLGAKCEAPYHCPYALVSLLNRLASLCFFGSFSACAICWAEIAGASSGDDVRQAALRRARVLFGVLNFWLVVAMGGSMAYRYFIRLRGDQQAALYDADQTEVGILSALIAATIGHYGSALYRASRALDDTHALTRARCRLLAATLAVCVLSAVRAALFLYRPLTGRTIGGLLGRLLYPWAWYVVPEVGSGMVVISVMWPARAAGSRLALSGYHSPPAEPGRPTAPRRHAKAAGGRREAPAPMSPAPGAGSADSAALLQPPPHDAGSWEEGQGPPSIGTSEFEMESRAPEYMV